MATVNIREAAATRWFWFDALFLPLGMTDSEVVAPPDFALTRRGPHSEAASGGWLGRHRLPGGEVRLETGNRIAPGAGHLRIGLIGLAAVMNDRPLRTVLCHAVGR